MTKNKKIFILAIFLAGVFCFSVSANAQVRYDSEIILDRDLDGLTDEGEKQIFKTDELGPDSDSDGILDGAEVIGQSNPLGADDPKAREVVLPKAEKETPWAWYITRVSALIGFFLLYLSFLFGLVIRGPLSGKIIDPADAYRVHGWISLQALFFAFIHGVSLLFDKFLGFGLKDILVPLAFNPGENLLKIGVSQEAIALGVVSFYIMLALVLSSYARKYIGQKAWRILHFSNIALYVFTAIHAFNLGTDLKNILVKNIFLGANLFLGLLIAVHLIRKIWFFLRSKRDKVDVQI